MSVLWFPDLPGQSYESTRTPHWDGLMVQTAASGKESRAQQWSNVKWEWTLKFNYLYVADLAAMGGLHSQSAGGLLSFAYQDDSDNRTTGEFIGTGNGSATQFQLQRAMGSYVEPIYIADTRGAATYGSYTRPAAQTFKVYVNGSQVTATVNTDTGVATLAAAPAGGAVITADFSYGFRVRFLDKFDITNFSRKIFEVQELKLLQCAT